MVCSEGWWRAARDLQTLGVPVVLPRNRGQAGEKAGAARKCDQCRTELVSGQQFWRETLFSEQLAHQPQRSSFVAPTLLQDFEDFPLVIDSTPQVHPLAGDANDHLVEVPAIAWAGPPLAQPSREHRSELQHPAPYRLIGDIEPAVDE